MELNVIVTNACNLKCTYCYEGQKNNQWMSKDIGRQTIDFYLSQAVPNAKLNLNFHGGEPLLAFDLIKDMTSYFKEKAAAASHEIGLSLTTNGTLITDEIAQYLSEHQFEIHLSLDGKAETHNLHRKTLDDKDTFEKVVQGAEMLRRVGCPFTVRMTVTPQNVSDLVQNVSWLLEQGYSRLNIGVDFFADWTGCYDQLENAYGEIKNIYLMYLDKNRPFMSIFDGKFPSYLLTGKPLFCNAGFGHYTVNTKGELYPCVYVFDQEPFCFGTLKDGIYEEKRAQCIKDHSIQADKCKHCDIAYFCHGRKCWYLNYIATGYLTLPNEALCRHEKILYKLVGELVDDLYQRNDIVIGRMLEIVRNNPTVTPNQAIVKYLEKREG